MYIIYIPWWTVPILEPFTSHQPAQVSKIKSQWPHFCCIFLVPESHPGPSEMNERMNAMAFKLSSLVFTEKNLVSEQVAKSRSVVSVVKRSLQTLHGRAGRKRHWHWLGGWASLRGRGAIYIQGYPGFRGLQGLHPTVHPTIHHVHHVLPNKICEIWEFSTLKLCQAAAAAAALAVGMLRASVDVCSSPSISIIVCQFTDSVDVPGSSPWKKLCVPVLNLESSCKQWLSRDNHQWSPVHHRYLQTMIAEAYFTPKPWHCIATGGGTSAGLAPGVEAQ